MLNFDEQWNMSNWTLNSFQAQSIILQWSVRMLVPSLNMYCKTNMRKGWWYGKLCVAVARKAHLLLHQRQWIVICISSNSSRIGFCPWFIRTTLQSSFGHIWLAVTMLVIPWNDTEPIILTSFQKPIIHQIVQSYTQ